MSFTPSRGRSDSCVLEYGTGIPPWDACVASCLCRAGGLGGLTVHRELAAGVIAALDERAVASVPSHPFRIKAWPKLAKGLAKSSFPPYIKYIQKFCLYIQNFCLYKQKLCLYIQKFCFYFMSDIIEVYVRPSATLCLTLSKFMPGLVMFPTCCNPWKSAHWL